MTAPAAERKKLRVLALVHPDLIPPEDAKREDSSPWKMEYDVINALRKLEHEVIVVPVGDELGGIRNVKTASPEQLQALSWLPKPVAAAVHERLHPGGR